MALSVRTELHQTSKGVWHVKTCKALVDSLSWGWQGGRAGWYVASQGGYVYRWVRRCMAECGGTLVHQCNSEKGLVRAESVNNLRVWISK